jgi:large subunit ribosomal protein L24
LSSTTIGSGTSQPEIQLFLAGPPGALTRNVDVTSLSSWLAVRVIDRETRRLDAIERGQPPQAEPAAPPSTAALPLPATPPKPPVIAPRPPAAPPIPAAPPGPSAANPPAAVSQQLAPLPAPIEVRPPPGPPPAPSRPRPRPPLVLTPPVTTNQ